MVRRNKDLGDWGEKQACDFLVRYGFAIVEQNFHTTTGEVDIIARKGSDIYFIEVKTRLEQALATDEAITGLKKMKFQRAVRAYSYRHDTAEECIVLAGLVVLVDKHALSVRFRMVTW